MLGQQMIIGQKKNKRQNRHYKKIKINKHQQ